MALAALLSFVRHRINEIFFFIQFPFLFNSYYLNADFTLYLSRYNCVASY